MLIVKTSSAAIFEVCFGKMSKRCAEDLGLTTPPKIKAIQRYRPEHHEVDMFIPFVKRRFVRSTSTSLAHMVVETIARGT